MRCAAAVSMLACSVAAVALSAGPAAAAPPPDDSYPYYGPVVTRVHLVKGGSVAQVHIRARCPQGDSYSIDNVEVAQDSTPSESPFDVIYQSTQRHFYQCTGRLQHLRILVVPDTSGQYAPAGARLKRGLASTALGGEFEQLMFVQVEDVRLR